MSGPNARVHIDRNELLNYARSGLFGINLAAMIAACRSNLVLLRAFTK
jgi:hypothetical protein